MCIHVYKIVRKDKDGSYILRCVKCGKEVKVSKEVIA